VRGRSARLLALQPAQESLMNVESNIFEIAWRGLTNSLNSTLFGGGKIVRIRHLLVRCRSVC